MEEKPEPITAVIEERETEKGEGSVVMPTRLSAPKVDDSRCSVSAYVFASSREDSVHSSTLDLPVFVPPFGIKCNKDIGTYRVMAIHIPPTTIKPLPQSVLECKLSKDEISDPDIGDFWKVTVSHSYYELRFSTPPPNAYRSSGMKRTKQVLVAYALVRCFFRDWAIRFPIISEFPTPLLYPKTTPAEASAVVPVEMKNLDLVLRRTAIDMTELNPDKESTPDLAETSESISSSIKSMATQLYQKVLEAFTPIVNIEFKSGSEISPFPKKPRSLAIGHTC